MDNVQLGTFLSRVITFQKPAPPESILRYGGGDRSSSSTKASIEKQILQLAAGHALRSTLDL